MLRVSNREIAAVSVVEAEVGEAVPDDVPSEIKMHDPFDDPVDHLSSLAVVGAA